MAYAMDIVNCLRVLKRNSSPPVSSEDLCAILTAPLLLPAHKAWFQECESYGVLRAEGKQVVLAEIERLCSRGLLSTSAVGTLSLECSNLHLLREEGGGQGAPQPASPAPAQLQETVSAASTLAL